MQPISDPIVSGEKNNYLIAGDEVTLTCTVDKGSYTAKVEWFQDNTSLQEGTYRSGIEI